jgi:uroporphyrinogen-III synthase
VKVWVTRSEPGASATGCRLEALGHVPLVAPLLAVEPLPAPPGLPEALAALAFTSANGVRAFAAAFSGRNWPVFAVGEATAAAARAEGFDQVVSAEADVKALARRIVTARPAGLVLHASGLDRADDLQARLEAAGVEASTLPLYQTVAVDRLPLVIAEALRAGGLDAVLVHSPKAGRVLAALLAGCPASECARLQPFGLSLACVEPLAGLASRPGVAASTPDEAALLERLG